MLQWTVFSSYAQISSRNIYLSKFHKSFWGADSYSSAVCTPAVFILYAQCPLRPALFPVLPVRCFHLLWHSVIYHNE